MTLAPFAALESRLNRANIRHLANRVALLCGEDVPGIYEAPTEIGGVGIGMATTQPVFVVNAADLRGENPIGQTITFAGCPINGYEDYLVAAVQDDGAGMLRLILELP